MKKYFEPDYLPSATSEAKDRMPASSVDAAESSSRGHLLDASSLCVRESFQMAKHVLV
jgi:hypothetical protein